MPATTLSGVKAARAPERHTWRQVVEVRKTLVTEDHKAKLVEEKLGDKIGHVSTAKDVYSDHQDEDGPILGLPGSSRLKTKVTSISQKAKISDQWRTMKAAEKEWRRNLVDVNPGKAYSDVIVEIHPSDNNL